MLNHCNLKLQGLTIPLFVFLHFIAIPFPIAELPNAFEVISEALGIDFTQMKLEKAEYTLGIVHDQPIEHIVESLGNASSGDRFSMQSGARWNGLGFNNSIQVYSTNLKNKRDVRKNIGERCTELEQLSEEGLDVIRIEMRKSYPYLSKERVSELIKPGFFQCELEVFKDSFKKIRKNLTQLPIQGLQDVDFLTVLNKVKNSKDLSKILIALGTMFLHDLAIKVIASRTLRNKSRLFSLLSESLLDAQEMSKKFKFEEHFHCVVMSALEHFSDMYNVAPSTEIKESYSPMELII